MASIFLNRSKTRIKNRTKAKKPFANRRRPWLEALENRIAPTCTQGVTFNPGTNFQLQGSAFADAGCHDWNQVFADAGSPNRTANDPSFSSSNSFTQGPTSGAQAGVFINDALGSVGGIHTDDIFTGGGSKDVLGLQSGPWLF